MGSLSIAEFESAMDRHGADLGRWPDALRSSAEALLEASDEARHLHALALQLDAALRAPPKAPAGLADRIVLAATRPGPARRRR